MKRRVGLGLRALGAAAVTAAMAVGAWAAEATDANLRSSAPPC